jgi:hypothetical protein
MLLSLMRQKNVTRVLSDLGGEVSLASSGVGSSWYWRRRVGMGLGSSPVLSSPTGCLFRVRRRGAGGVRGGAVSGSIQ